MWAEHKHLRFVFGNSGALGGDAHAQADSPETVANASEKILQLRAESNNVVLICLKREANGCDDSGDVDRGGGYD